MTSGNDICLGLLMRMTERKCAAAPEINGVIILRSSRDQEIGLNEIKMTAICLMFKRDIY